MGLSEHSGWAQSLQGCTWGSSTSPGRLGAPGTPRPSAAPDTSEQQGFSSWLLWVWVAPPPPTPEALLGGLTRLQAGEGAGSGVSWPGALGGSAWVVRAAWGRGQCLGSSWGCQAQWGPCCHDLGRGVCSGELWPSGWESFRRGGRVHRARGLVGVEGPTSGNSLSALPRSGALGGLCWATAQVPVLQMRR